MRRGSGSREGPVRGNGVVVGEKDRGGWEEGEEDERQGDEEQKKG